MPVITRSMSKRLLSSVPKDAELHTSKDSSSNEPLKDVVVNKKRRQSQPKRQSKQQSRKPSKQQSRRQSRKQSHKDQEPNQEKPPGGSPDVHSSNAPSATITHWPCRQCDCPQGVFKSLVPTCINCSHEMDNHKLQDSSPWNPNCPYVCERQDLVSSLLQLAQTKRVVVIRGTPAVGKTTLLRLLGHHILFNEQELEPVYVDWKPKNERNHFTYRKYLSEKTAVAQDDNAKYRPHNPNARKVYLIDEAQDSYEDEEFWSTEFKNRSTSERLPIFVLACHYGAAGIPSIQSQLESHNLTVDTFDRVELRPSKSNSLYMLFKSEETLTVISKWVMKNHLKPESVDCVNIAEYIHSATNGHPGMVGAILDFFELLISQDIQNAQKLSPAFCHELLAEHKRLEEFLSQHGRGVWPGQGEDHIKNYLRDSPSYSHLKYSDITDAMRKVAKLPRGYTEPESDSSNALAFCHKMGFLHAEQPSLGSSEITYIFPSQIHQRIAYRHLMPAS